MKKKITDENGKVYVEKKPFYKKGCFWILAVIAIIIIGAVAGAEMTAAVTNLHEAAMLKHRIIKMTELFRKMRN